MRIKGGPGKEGFPAIVMLQKPKGTIDILPDESRLWQYVEKTLCDKAAAYGFGQIRLPTFEYSELYKRGVGQSSDIVQKEMYSFYDNDKRNLTLRPEGTAGVVRSVIENGLVNEAMPLSLYYLISCFRYEMPQTGRSREFYQFGAEVFGADSPSCDADLMTMVSDMLSTLKVNAHLEINSIGCKRCRPIYHKALREYFGAYRKELCPTCLERLETNPLRILDCKSEICKSIAVNAPKTVDYLCEPCAKHFEGVKSFLDEGRIAYRVNPRIVRGLDYYQRTVFEFISDDIGSQSTICGGGRYNGLVSELGGPDVSGIGFAMGLTRIMLAMKKNDAEVMERVPDLYLASMGDKAALAAFRLAGELRKQGALVLFDQVGRSLKAQMKYADKKGVRYTMVLGDSELEGGVATLKNMETGENKEVSLSADAVFQGMK